MNREEHLDWAKRRALEYCDAGDIPGALASFLSDMNKHEQLSIHPGLIVLVGLMRMGALGDAQSVRKFIEGFN